MKEVARRVGKWVVEPGDRFVLQYGGSTIMDVEIDHKATYDTAIVFQVEEGDFPGLDCGIGGMVGRAK